jgi:hypothetical protein
VLGLADDSEKARCYPHPPHDEGVDGARDERGEGVIAEGVGGNEGTQFCGDSASEGDAFGEEKVERRDVWEGGLS